LATVNCSGLALIDYIELEAGPHPREDEWTSHTVHLHLTPQFILRAVPLATAANDNALRPVRCRVTVPLDTCLFDREHDALEQLYVAHRSRFALVSKLHSFSRLDGTLRESATTPGTLDATFELNQVAPGTNEMALIKQTPSGAGESYALAQDKSIVIVHNTNVMQLVITFVVIAMTIIGLLLAIKALANEAMRRAHEFNIAKLNAHLHNMWKQVVIALRSGGALPADLQ
ncbi:MAG: hypothetical protein KDK08_29930, partial [Rhizobiaceae bacterium]|nr:hypothetical protein [Rhizobiaceae bacterium]